MDTHTLPTDLADTEWELLRPLLEPTLRRGRLRHHPLRVVLIAIFYALHTPPQRAEALALVRAGLSLRTVAAKFPGVSYGAIWRLTRTAASRDQTEGSDREEDMDGGEEDMDEDA